MTLEVQARVETRPYRVPEPVIYNLLRSILNIPNASFDGLGLGCLREKENREFLETTKKSLDEFYASASGPSENALNELVEFVRYFSNHQSAVHDIVRKESTKRLLRMLSVPLSTEAKTELFISAIKNPMVPVEKPTIVYRKIYYKNIRDRFIRPSPIQLAEFRNLFALNANSTDWKYASFRDASRATFDEIYTEFDDEKAKKRKRGNFISNVETRQKSLIARMGKILQSEIPEGESIGEFLASLQNSTIFGDLSKEDILKVLKREFPIKEHLKKMKK